MALRTIREIGDPVLNKRSKEVTEMTDRLRGLISDMKETLYDSGGVGLAAPQVGVLKRIVLIDISEEQNDLHVFVDPVIVETSGEQTGYEGCLSVPGKVGTVTRPDYVRVMAKDANMVPFEFEGTQLMARALCHEIDHLDGKLYVDLVEGELMDSDAVRDEEEEEGE